MGGKVGRAEGENVFAHIRIRELWDPKKKKRDKLFLMRSAGLAVTWEGEKAQPQVRHNSTI